MIPENPAGHERMARQVARHFGELADVYGMVCGHRADDQNDSQLAASTRISSKSHLMDDPD
jgi:hypothetical protein